MILIIFFYFLGFLNFAKIREFLAGIQWVNLLKKIVLITIIICFKAIVTIFKVLLGIIIRFFKFFGYINWKTLREVFDRSAAQRLPGLSSEMAYNAMLALFPALLAILAAIGMFKYLQNTLYRLVSLLGVVVPGEVQNLIRDFFQEIVTSNNQQLFSLGFIAALWAFSSVISAAMAALDQIYQVPIAQTRSFWQAKLVSIGLSIGTIVLLLSASATVFISNIIVRIIARQSCLVESVKNCQIQALQNCRLEPLHKCQLEIQLLNAWRWWQWPIALGIVSVAFAFIYCWGPSRLRSGTPIMPGAVIAALLWAIISYLFRLYVEHFGTYNRTYGAIGAVIILLLWLYLSSLVMLLGAQLNVTVGEVMQREKNHGQ